MKYFLFDFDGTLVDSMPYYAAAMIRILDENNIQYPTDIVKIITPLGYGGTADYYREKLGVRLKKEKILSLMQSYAAEAYLTVIPAKAYVKEVLTKLKASGASLNVLTASPHSVLDPCLERLGMLELFDNVWSCEDFSTTKADPEIYKMAAEKIGTPVTEILFLDDNYNADVTAKTAGMKVCGVFDESSAEYEAQMRGVCDYYIRDFSELTHII